MKIGIKESVGFLTGVVVGKFIFKSNNLLVLTALGVAGGVISHFLIKNKDAETKEYISNLKEEISNHEVESNFYGTNREMEFNKDLGYHTPNGKIVEQEPRDFMDVNY